jgi:hypothetical protein
MIEMTRKSRKRLLIFKSGNARQKDANPSVWRERAQTTRRRIRRQSIEVRMGPYYINENRNVPPKCWSRSVWRDVTWSKCTDNPRAESGAQSDS